MQAIRVERMGGPEELKVCSMELPAPSAGQAQVRVSFAGVNFLDVYHRRGDYNMPLPLIPGVEGSGVIETIGPGPSNLSVGQHVAWAMSLGSYAEKINVPVEKLVPIPAGVTDEQAAAAMLQGVTAHFLSHSTYAIQPGDVVLVHAAAGGVGSLLVQMARGRGARVLATISSDEKTSDVLANGGEVVLNSRGGDFVARVREVTDGQGVHAVYDGIGKSTWRQSLDCLARRGSLIIYGQASGAVPPLDLELLKAQGSLYVTRPTVADYTATQEELLARVARVFAGLLDRTLRVRIDAVLPLSSASEAHRQLEGRQTRGKLLLVPEQRS